MPSLQLAAGASWACDHIFTVGAELALYGPSQKGQHIRRPAHGFLQRSPVLSSSYTVRNLSRELQLCAEFSNGAGGFMDTAEQDYSVPGPNWLLCVI